MIKITNIGHQKTIAIIVAVFIFIAVSTGDLQSFLRGILFGGFFIFCFLALDTKSYSIKDSRFIVGYPFNPFKKSKIFLFSNISSIEFNDHNNVFEKGREIFYVNIKGKNGSKRHKLSLSGF